MSRSCHDHQQSPIRPPKISRREWLRVGGLSWLGLNEFMLRSLRRETAALGDDRPTPVGKAKRCVFIFLFGGPSHIDLWDMKPLAPENVRGIFQPIATAAAGIQLSELLPNLAQEADKLCLLRSMTHGDPVHGTACSQVITGRPHRRPGTTDTLAPDDWPSLSAMMMRYGKAVGGMPSSVVLPWYLMFPSQGARIAGQSSGLMGDAHNAFLIEGDPSHADFSVPGIRLPSDVPAARLLRREGLLREVDDVRRVLNDGPRSRLISDQYRQAFSMISGEQTAAACLEALDGAFFKALAEPARVALLRVLILQGRSDVGSIANRVPQDRSVVARHLQVLEGARLIRSTAEGRHTFYEIHGEGVLTQLQTLLDLFKKLAPICCPT